MNQSLSSMFIKIIHACCFGGQLKYKETKHFSWPVMKVKKVKSKMETATSVKLAIATM